MNSYYCYHRNDFDLEWKILQNRYHSLYTCWSDLFIYYACKIQVDIIVFSSHMSRDPVLIFMNSPKLDALHMGMMPDSKL